ncbi:MAG: hypothetical protein ACF8R9_03125 [Phycisphaerales bacterium JB054]
MRVRFRTIGVLSGLAVVAGGAAAQTGAPDRIEVTRFLSRSGIVLTDLNGDCEVSDVDVAMALLGRMTELYGPDLLVGDQDQDGVETYQDFVTAIERLMKGAFDKTAAKGQEAVSDAGDLNFHGVVNAGDLALTLDRFGESVGDHDVEQAAQSAAEYVGALVEAGVDAFMASGCAPRTHLFGVSDTWPPQHPGWWQPNHLVSISNGYDGEAPGPLAHDAYASSHLPTAPHEVAISQQWPANHHWYASSSWDAPALHITFSSSAEYPPPHHEADVSKSWPPGHAEAESSTRPKDHEAVVSRTWWPGHTYDDSVQRVMPPLHSEAFTATWVHETQNSQSRWPPNHTPSMSGSWGWAHQRGVSTSFPPGHLSYASNTWPGPQPTWPAGHTTTVSQSWGAPGPGEWPVFPPEHSWWTTFQHIATSRNRWPW